ncbi:MAG: pilus assembly protein PilM [Candidatus Omnitrophica bacterium]|nr:pilus assembly protein PilM [Candidatus Omnitrophota bacterium]
MSTRVIVEWTRATLRVVMAQGSQKHPKVRLLHWANLNGFAEVGHALQTFVKKQRLPRDANLITVIPREFIITRVVKFPAKETAELAQMVELYGRAQLPYPREQAVTDWYVLQQEGGFSTVVIVACQREVIDRQLSLLGEVGLSASEVTVSSWGVLGWYQWVLDQKEEVVEPCLVVNVDDTRTDLVLISNGRILSSRSVGQGTQDWEHMGESAQILTAEMERSRAAIRKEIPGTEVHSLLLTGGGHIEAWREQVANRLGLPVVVKPGVIPGSSEQLSWSAVVAVGLAMRDSVGRIELSPPEMRGSLAHHQQMRELGLLACLVISALVFGSAWLGMQVYRQGRLSRQLDEALVAVAPEANQVQKKARLLQMIRSALEERRALGFVLSQVFERTPPNVTLEGLTFERPRQQISVKGTAGSTQELLDYIKLLEGIEGIRMVELKYSTQRNTPAGPRTSFEVLMFQSRNS